jgi:AcrR family transcriptional regulator
MSASVNTDVISESNRERLLRAGMEVCAERGYEEASIAEIAERAGLAEEDFTNLFADVAACLAAAMSEVMARTLAEVSGAYKPDRSEWENGLAGLKRVLEMMAAHPSWAHLAYIGSRQMGPPAIRTAYENGIGVFESMVARMWAYSKIEIQPQSVPRAAIGSGEAVIRAKVAADEAERLPEVLPDFVYGLTVPFFGHSAALRLAAQGRELLRGTRWES